MGKLGWEPEVVLNTTIPMLELALEGFWDLQELLHGDPEKRKKKKKRKHDPEGVKRMLDELAEKNVRTAPNG